MMARVSVSFTEGHYYGRGERPNTELAHNSLSICIKVTYHAFYVYEQVSKLSADLSLWIKCLCLLVFLMIN